MDALGDHNRPEGQDITLRSSSGLRAGTRSARLRRIILAMAVAVALGLLLAPMSRVFADRDPSSGWPDYVRTTLGVFIVTYLLSGVSRRE